MGQNTKMHMKMGGLEKKLRKQDIYDLNFQLSFSFDLTLNQTLVVSVKKRILLQILAHY